ncbi:MAG: tetratricopeptide repeat protein, partial [Planctomycetes bacterium]|nr:tetratricopeptide repeat protein [Planctomycetota bacterium]
HVQLGCDSTGQYLLAIIFDRPEPKNEIGLRQEFARIGNRLSGEVFQGRLTQLRLCNNRFGPWTTIPVIDDSSWHRAEDRAEALQAEGQTDEAIATFRSAIEIAEKFGEQKHQIVISLNNLGNYYLTLEKLDEAEAALKRALDEGETALGPTSYEIGYTLNALGCVYASQDRNAEAEDLLRRAVAARRIYPGEKSADLTESLDRLGRMLYFQKKYADAHSVFRQELELREQNRGGDVDREDLVTLKLFTSCCRSLDKPADAEQFLQRECQALEKSNEDVATLLIMILSDLEDVQYDQNKFDAAVETCNRWLLIAERKYGLHSREAASAAFSLARSRLALQEYGTAEVLFRRVLKIAEANVETPAGFIAMTHSCLGTACHRLGRPQEAENYYRQSLELFEKQPGEFSVGLVWILDVMANFHIERGELQAAEALRRRALAVAEQARPTTDAAVGNAVMNLAIICHKQKKLAEAEPLLQRALAIYVDQRGDGDFMTNWIREWLAMFYAEQRRDSEAEALYLQAIGSLAQQWGEPHLAVSNAQSALASFYWGRGRFTEAEGLIRQVIASREKEFGPQSADVALALDSLASLRDLQGKPAESIVLFEKALETLSITLAPDHPFLIGILEKYAGVLRKANRPADAAAAEKRAADIREQWFKSRRELEPQEGGFG